MARSAPPRGGGSTKPVIARQGIWLAVVVVANVLLWMIPSDVVELIANDRQTLLGRYSRTHFAWIIGVATISVVGCYIDWSTGETYRRRWFRVLAAMLVFLPGLAVVDFFLRRPEDAHYVRDGLAYHRPVNETFELTFTDRPEAYRTYPQAPAAYPPVPCVLRTDGRGYRNQSDRTQYDIVVLGDSFAEGSNVSDEHVWPARLAERRGESVYNLGMSGYGPLEYLESLERHGLPLHPRRVLCMIYEGNDFRSAKSDRKRGRPSLSSQIKHYIKRSPIIGSVDRMMIETLGPVRAAAPVDGVDVLDWMPLSVPSGPDGRHYTFAPKQLRDLFVSADAFAVDRHWLNARSHLERMKRLCAEADCELTVVYAPSEAHVTLPLVADGLDARKVRAFTAMSFKKPLPDAEVFLHELLAGCDARESVVRTWCERQGVGFIGLAEPLREAAREGKQVYYTYDQHWAPPGHDVVAGVIHRELGADRSVAEIAGRVPPQAPGDPGP
jgi:hypothetical protein